MLHIVVISEGREQVLEHAGGPLDFGRGPAQDGVPRCFLGDPYVSRSHLRVEPLPSGLVRVSDLSGTGVVRVDGSGALQPGQAGEFAAPLLLRLGNSEVHISQNVAAEPTMTVPLPAAPAPSLRAATQPTAPGDTQAGPAIDVVAAPLAPGAQPVALRELGEAPDAETLAHWFERLVGVQQSAATSAEFLDATALAVVELVGMDRGAVLLREGAGWRTAAAAPASRAPFSHTILDEVLRRKQTVYRNFGPEFFSVSLVGVDTVVAAPVLNGAQEIVGVVYGARSLQPDHPPPRIAPLEAVVMQVLAAAAGAGLERQQQEDIALRNRVQFEQFFSPQLAQELAADPSLLEGREREVTMLFTDVRNFSRISERLGPNRTFAMMQDVMELQSVHIRETGGVVVDYVGDGLLAMWNAPADQPDHPARAAATVAAFLQELPALSAKWEAAAGEPLRIGAGVHTGIALVGNTGSRVKFKYGPMGPAVNLASRLENATKALGVSPLISAATRNRLPAAFGTRRLGSLRVQGFADPVGVYELFPGDTTAAWRARRDEFERALEAFEGGLWTEACQSLATLLTSAGDYDIPSLQLLSRSVECLRSRPDRFDPAIVIQKQA